MARVCGRCGVVLREAEPHPESICVLIAAARQVCKDAQSAPDGALVTRSAYTALADAVEALLTLTPADLASAGGLNLQDGSWEVVSETGISEGDLPGSAPVLTVVPGGRSLRRLFRHEDPS